MGLGLRDEGLVFMDDGRGVGVYGLEVTVQG